VNKQPPNKQIWLSSPISSVPPFSLYLHSLFAPVSSCRKREFGICRGPKRYDFDPEEKVWFYARDGSTMQGLLNEELRQLLEDEKIEIILETGE